MNLNVILAILQQKAILSRVEVDKIVDYLKNSPQSSEYKFALEDIKNLLSNLE